MATESEIEAFKARWLASTSAERSNSQLFLTELTDLMGVPHPGAAQNDPDADTYVFERKVQLAHPGGERVGWIDLYKAGCFVLESKQGANEGKLGGFAKRDTPGWENEMERARGQAKGYAQTLKEPPPFVIVCDVGHVFELHACFDGGAHWTAFPEPPRNRIYLKSLDAEKLALLRTIWTDPLSLDPTRTQARVSREVAATLAELARTLEAGGHTPEAVARFLMRCIFTMFAEDIGLFPEKRKLFQEYLEQFWIKNPAGFASGVEAFWSTMNKGGYLPTGVPIRRFNGGLFADHSGLPLDTQGLAFLLEAAKHDWSQVEPAIFGTLLERALDPKERHRLGAHYTPRAYVERLVRPTLEEPLRADWLVVQAEARRLREAGKVKDAAKALSAFHKRLCEVKVLDPACGSGNFLYVALDLMKRLEAEVREELWRLGDQNELLEFDGLTVRPSQFLGIEKKRWAKEIAELVLWIGYLRWHFRAKGDRGEVQVPEPVLENYENIECRDAVLDWDGAPVEQIVTDERGVPVTRWDGETTKTDPITGMQVPDESATVVLKAYPNARRAEWPEADFIVGNPPFVGNKRMRLVLGPGYVDALRKAHVDVPESADYVMYWWNAAANLVRDGGVIRFGLITTNSITQTYNRRVVEAAVSDGGASIVLAIPNHPWVDGVSGADVRIAMTALARGQRPGTLLTVASEVPSEEEAIAVTLTAEDGVVWPDLHLGVNVWSAVPLRANEGLSFMGVTLDGDAFVLEYDDGLLDSAPAERVPRYLIGRDLTQRGQDRYVIDLFGLTEEDAAREVPALYQRVLVGVKPKRDAKASRSKDAAAYARLWWLMAKSRPDMRAALSGLHRFIVTCRSARHRTFSFIENPVLVESTVVAVASDDAFTLGVLSSRPHLVWALRAGSRLGIGDDPRYNNTRCFRPYAFPEPTDDQKARIRDLAERLDAHRKRQLAAHPKLTITGMYKRPRETPGQRRAHRQRPRHPRRRPGQPPPPAPRRARRGGPRSLRLAGRPERRSHPRAPRRPERRARRRRSRRPRALAPPRPPGPRGRAHPGRAPRAEQEPAPRRPPGRGQARQVAQTLRRARRPRPRHRPRRPPNATFSVPEVLARFKRAKPADIEDILETFVALGHLVAFDTPDQQRRWARPAHAA